MVELVDTLASGASAFGRGGSSPLICTIDIIKKSNSNRRCDVVTMSFLILRVYLNT